ncbi:hypothetical protein [Mycobacterium sp. NPDC050441]|uniref:hypothetical protein n=1 Tax=Mycobacterium sp. NPDC050441 TaxID=3155403 RepID=UPI0033CCAE89
MPPGPQSLPPFNLPPAPSPKSWVKWVVIAVVVVVVLAGAIVAIAVLKGKGSSPGGSDTVSAAPSDVASAGDKNPATIVVEDVSCDAQTPIFKNFYDAVKASGFEDLDHSVPASLWSPEERRINDEAKRATAAAIAQMGPLAKLTPHRVRRELYDQTMAYWQAWIDKIPTYVGSDDAYRAAGTEGQKALVRMCNAIQYKSAQARSFLADPAIAPKGFAPVTSNAPQPFLGSGSDQCSDYSAALAAYYDDPVVKDWQKIDYKLDASGWDSNQRQLSDQAADILVELAHKLAGLGGDSGNPVMADFTALGAQYITAYAHAMSSYTSNDDSLVGAGLSLMRSVNFACKAAG